MITDKVSIRTIEQKDNPQIARLIRSILAEFNNDKPGTVFTDEATDYIYEQFQNPRTVYYVIEHEGEIIGGAGINKLPGFDDVCELQKMYLVPAARGRGLSNRLLQMCMDFAKMQGYRKIYLESIDNLKAAISLYKKFGFKVLDKPLLQTGHYSCNVWMAFDF